jgi:ribonuclease R
LCKSAFVTFDENGQPVSSAFANTVIRSAARLRYREAQALIDGAGSIPHPDGPRTVDQYKPAVVELLRQMNALARVIQKRRLAAGQIVLNLPEVDLVLDENGKVVGTREEDQSFTHTLIEMFMVEANEAVARLLDSLGVPFLRRVHPEPELANAERLRNFATVSGHKLPKTMDRKTLQALLASVQGKPEAFAINLAVLKSLTRAEYSPKVVGHYALASEHYCHFTSPIRRYADLTIHRLLDAYFKAGGGLRPGRDAHGAGSHGGKKRKIQLESFVPGDVLNETGRHLSFTERRGDDAERELRKIKLLELLSARVGEDFKGVVTGITQFGIFVQLQEYLIDGVIRFEDLMDDWWQIDEKSGLVRGQRTGRTIRIGDLCVARVVKVDVPRRDLSLAIMDHLGRPGKAALVLPAVISTPGKLGGGGKTPGKSKFPTPGRGKKPSDKSHHRGGGPARGGKTKKRTGRGRGR